MNAMAHVPGGVETPGTSRGSLHAAVSGKTRRDAERGLREAKGSEQQSVPEFVEVTATESGSPATGKQQWVVLTTWEEVVAVHRHFNVVADYNVDATAATEGAGQAPQEVVKGVTPEFGEWAVTQLILRADPVRSDYEGNSRDTNSQPGQPAAMPLQPAGIPLQDGWLVLQL